MNRLGTQHESRGSSGQWTKVVALAFSFACAWAAVGNGRFGQAETLVEVEHHPNFTGFVALAQDQDDGKTNHRFIGNDSCINRGCHGDVTDTRTTRGGEYTHWLRNDPHTKAWLVPNQPLWKRILQGLDRNPERQTTIERQNCLPCHSYTHEQPDLDVQKTMFGAGVGCETCHGPAGDWLDHHYGPNKLSKDELLGRGMKETKNLWSRAKMCAGCHIGDEKRDMNHDMIAAGHPRLRFEFSTALWDLNQNKVHWKWSDRDFGQDTWKIGRLASAHSSVELLRNRVQRSLKKDAPWPEYSEFNCFACHKDLVSNDGLAFNPAIKPPLTVFGWGSWHFSEFETDFPQLKPALTELRAIMKSPRPSRKNLEAVCDQVLQAINNEAKKQLASPQPNLANQIQSQLKIINDQPAPGSRDWDAAAQHYLRVAAMIDELRKTQPKEAESYEQALAQIAKKLAFPKGFASPGRWWRKQDSSNSTKAVNP